MFDQGHTRLQILEEKIRTEMVDRVAQGVHFSELRTVVREIALEYPEFITWSPELRDDQAVADIWDRSWKPLASVSVQVSQEIQDAPVW
jgi:hypothetical protein